MASTPEPDIAPANTDLGFQWTARKDGVVVVTRDGQEVTTLRGAVAQRFLAGPAQATPAQAQQALARLTGNYRRGKERAAGLHRRNSD